jgi:hypothetical protein
MDLYGRRVEGSPIMFGVAPNPSPDGSNWTVAIGHGDAEDNEDDPEVTVVALTFVAFAVHEL